MARPPQRPGRPTQPQRVRRRANRRPTAQQRNCSPACPQPSLAALHPKHPQSAARAGAAPPAPTPWLRRPARWRPRRGGAPAPPAPPKPPPTPPAPPCLFRLEEPAFSLPMIVLEELDSHKNGMTEVARNGRQASRTLDALAAAAQGADMAHGVGLDSTGQRAAGGHLFFQTAPLDYSLPTSLPPGKADNQILGVVQALRKLHAPRQVVLVSKDINMRVKARALGLNAEDYQNDKTLEDGDLLY